MHALVGADRDRPLDARERAVAAFGQGLLDQRHAGLRAGGEVLHKIVVGPAFIGVDDELGVRRGAAHRGDPFAVVARAELHLEERPRPPRAPPLPPWPRRAASEIV